MFLCDKCGATLKPASVISTYAGYISDRCEPPPKSTDSGPPSARPILGVDLCPDFCKELIELMHIWLREGRRKT